MANPRATDEDLTAKARIRNTALDLYAQYGEERISLRAVASEAGVTLGLVQHHFKTKAGLREAVDQLVVDYFVSTLRSVEDEKDPRKLAAARDAAVRRMLEANPPIVNYVRRAVLEPSGEQMHLLDALIGLTRDEVATLRKKGMAPTDRTESTQVVSVLVRQMGALLLQPLIDAAWDRVQPGDIPKPTLSIKVRD
ncbi:TetR/AcrR family transcriptional regulator [Mycobacteroides saopaulense]|uniref:TetR family transcriptional regulator n=1 Tax=Mycobacteroides saopaulense TaxID=1578165 RepID=A0ABX3BYU1_9MYCO|nr:TetR/AcrR family transcriptional regulator [Mycobacteroides saopaulense]ALR13991.1 TetR family transcriptional regulator [Mycobacteroides saopaulense]OHT87098.1 TetR family transcriptional regulator [Mycobacteroides saopaulense]OHU08955.1 TetR family transcriptional regulator [Mycobacteroides saopaulense]